MSKPVPTVFEDNNELNIDLASDLRLNETVNRR